MIDSDDPTIEITIDDITPEMVREWVGTHRVYLRLHDAASVWQVVLDKQVRCEACDGRLQVQSPVDQTGATAQCDDCHRWYRYQISDGQLKSC